MCKKVCGNCKYSTIKKREFDEQILHAPVCHLIGVSENSEEEFDIDDYIEDKDNYLVYVTSAMCGDILAGKTLDMISWVYYMDKVEKCLRTNLKLRVAWYTGETECEMWEGK